MFAFILSSLVLWGCIERPLTLQLRFLDLSGLKKNNAVFFEKNKIGMVKNVSYSKQGDYLVKIEIIPEFKNAATEDSRFYIGNDPVDHSNKAVIVKQERPGGILLKNGSIVQGTVKSGYLDEIISDLREKAGVAESELREALNELKKSLDAKSQKFDQELEETLNDISRQFQNFKSEISKIPDSQEVKKLEESFKRFAEEFNKAQEDVRNFIRNDVIPKFREELNRLREQLRKEGREKELEKIDEQLNEVIMV
jgi:paraquat-inducible protein B